MGPEIQLRPFNADSKEKSKERAYIGWSPVPLTVIGNNSPGKPNKVKLTSKSLNKYKTRIEFKENAAAQPADELEIDLGDNGQATCFIAGKFQRGRPHNGASPDSKDVKIQAAWVDNLGDVKGSLDFMIRVRRDAQLLTNKARDDFTKALAELNAYGKGIYVTDFVALHVAGAYNSQHDDVHFLPWHRLYLLDLERQLQLVNPSVSLPYWRFDKPAPRVFDKNFMGATQHVPMGAIDPNTGSPVNFTQGTSGGRMAEFSSENRLSDWKIGDRNGIERVALFDPKNKAAPGWPDADFELLTEDETLALGGGNNEFGFRRPGRGFARMEGTPHGAAHVSFNGPVNYVPTAPQDPLFFLLHCNVDRLWAKWQFTYERDLPIEPETYPYQTKREGAFSVEPTYLAGLFAQDYTVVDALQWPWDDTWSKPYNLRPPGTRSRNFTKSRTGKDFSSGDNPNMPSIADALDAFGQRSTTNYLGFAYDDVPFDHGRDST